MEPSAYKHIFFDLDKTLTPSRAEILPEHLPLFERLCAERDVVVVSGGAEEQIKKQLPIHHKGNFYMLSQQGNYAVAKDGSVLWHESVSAEQERVVREFAAILTDEFLKEEHLVLPDPNDIFENRGSQLASSVIGFHAPNELKYGVDPDQKKRQALLLRHPQELEHLKEIGIQAMPAGTTTFDFILYGKHKGYNITRFIERMKWEKEACVYVGDALFPGGNDETVVGVIDTHAVQGPEETFEYVKEILKNPA